MTAQAFEVFTLVLPNPEWEPASTNVMVVPSNISYNLQDTTTFQTLSSTSDDNSDTRQGLLFVPDLAASDPCVNASKPYVPQNATRLANIPAALYPLVSIAPWFSINCTQSYLAASRSAGVRAAIFYQPGNSTSLPPQGSDPSWSLNDGGEWTTQNQYPVYAVSGARGSQLMNELSLYSGNMTDVPYGAELVRQYDARDLTRLFARIIIGGSPPSLPSLWVFLIIVLGILLVVVTSTSGIMHWIQRRHKNELRRRIINGEVDLEALGIKRLNVPQEVLDKMPVYVYTSRDPIIQSNFAATTSTPSSPTQPPRSELPHREVPFTQPTCAICLDDFEHNVTSVRELPCSHIFHPDCVDGFLRENSSLCPMCKKSVLPAGFCPADVTNAMVRRERLIRRMRERAPAVQLEHGTGTRQEGSFSSPMAIHHRMASYHRQFGRRPVSAPTTVATEMGAIRALPATDLPVEAPPPEVQMAGTSARRAWGRRRVAATVSQTRTAEDEEREQQQRRPTWRRAMGTVFPSMQ